MSGLKEAKSAYVAAESGLRMAKSTLNAATKTLYLELLAEKGLKEEQTCKLVDRKGKEQIGVFRLVEQTGGGIVLRFFAYKKDATLSGNPTAFHFGTEPDVSWESAGVTGVATCPPPEPQQEEV